MFFEQYAENMATLILDGSTVFLLGGVSFGKRRSIPPEGAAGRHL